MTTRQPLTIPDLHQLARDIAAALGAPWAYKPGRGDELAHYAEIVHKDGYGVTMFQHTREPLHFAGEFPAGAYLGYQVARPSINCSPDKSPAQLARDITRRLLPDYLPLWEKAAQQVRDREEHERKVLALRAELVPLFPGARVGPEHSNDVDRTISFHLANHNGYGEVKLSSDTVELHLRSIPAALAKSIARAIQAYAAHTDMLAQARKLRPDFEFQSECGFSVCDDCRRPWYPMELIGVDTIAERVDTTGPMPSGECPNCGALCYQEVR